MLRSPFFLSFVLCLPAACNDPAVQGADLAAGADLASAAPDLADLATEADLAAAPSACLTEASGDLSQVVMGAPFTGRNGPAQMTIVPVGSPRWLAGRRAALAWAARDCAAFVTAAADMGYGASLLRDTVSGTRHWVLIDKSQLYNGVFVFRAPEELAAARPLVVDAPHLGWREDEKRMGDWDTGDVVQTVFPDPWPDGLAIDVQVMSARAAELLRMMPFKAPPDMSRFVLSPMPGLLVDVAVKPGQTVQAGERLAVIEAMKMENILTATQDGVVKEVMAAKGESLAVDQPIIAFG